MLARAVFVSTLAALMVAAAGIFYVLGEPRRRGLAGQVSTSSFRLDREDRSDELRKREVRFLDPSETLVALPTSDSALEKVLTEVAKLPDEGTPHSAEPDERNTSTANEPETSPRIFEAPHIARPLSDADSASAPNQPAVLVPASATSVAKADATDGDDLITTMKALHDPRTAAQAESVLKARGFASNHIELARRFTSPGFDVRCDAVRSVISVRGIVPRDWLLWASRDPQREVRLTAIGLMLTSGEAELLGRVDQIALEDPDPEVRGAAGRGLDQLRDRQ